MPKFCDWCGEEIAPTKGRGGQNRRYCTRQHYQVCAICSKQFPIKDMGAIPKCCSKECTAKARTQGMRATMLEKYGVEYNSQIPEVKAKMQASLAPLRKQIAEKRKATMLEKYGAEYPMQVDQFRDQIFNTNLEKYGDTNPAHNAEIRKKISEAISSEAAQAKYRTTSLEHFGVEHPAQSQEVLEQMKSTCVERYGAPFASQNSEVKQKIAAANIQRYVNDPEASKRLSAAIHKASLEKFGVDWPCQRAECRDAANKTISAVNKQIFQRLSDFPYDVKYEFSVQSYSYDLGILDQRILIEVDPTYTHNIYGNHYGVPRSADYHLLKTQAAVNAGYRCIHIFDWDDQDKIISSLQPKQTLYARNCEVSLVTSLETNAFEDKFHYQNKVRGQLFCFGLYFQGALIQLMTFGKPRYNAAYDLELLRLCTDFRYKVVGGAERLWSAFRKQQPNASVISYCDLSKFTGDVYTRLGMTLSYTTPPQVVWSKGTAKVTANLLRQRGFDQLFHTDFGKGTSNDQLMIDHGWLPVCDCGQAVYIFKPEDYRG